MTRRSGTLACLLAALLVGCGTVQEHRARHRGDAFARLSPEIRQRVLRGELHIGDAPEAAYIALGTPQYTTSDQSGRWVWVYWGTRDTRSAPGATATKAVPLFHTRADLRLPRPGEKREELRLFFNDKKLEEWKLGEIRIEEAAGKSALQLGTVPER